jgi:AcrR family transcriptional regulator
MAERDNGPDLAASVWLRQPADKPRSKSQPGLSLDRIVAAAVELLDAEGTAALSMRRLAADLGSSTMSLYWYVSTKHDLLEYAIDHVMGEVVIPPEGQPWQPRITALTRALRVALLRHAWAAQLVSTTVNLGPNSLRVTDTAYKIMQTADLTADEVEYATNLVGQYAYGAAMAEAQWFERTAAASVSYEELQAQATAALKADGRFPSVVERMERVTGSGTQDRDRQFDYGLAAIIAGIEATRS